MKERGVKERGVKQRAVKRRFVEGGRRLSAFAGEFDVVCPKCGGAAQVRRDWEPARCVWGPASVACTACGFARRQPRTAGGLPEGWAGPVIIIGRRPCGNCGRKLAVRHRARVAPRHPVIPVTCHGCGAVSQVSGEMHRVTVPAALVDSCFGLPLRLRTPCAGETLWAFNAQHLAYLRDFLQADLREQRGPYHGSMGSRLPRWLTSAKHRKHALRAAERLAAMLPGVSADAGRRTRAAAPAGS